MGERFKNLLNLVKVILGWIFTAYMVYLFFLYLWSTFNYIVPKASFVLALLFTAPVVGYIGWKYFPLGARK